MSFFIKKFAALGKIDFLSSQVISWNEKYNGTWLGSVSKAVVAPQDERTDKSKFEQIYLALCSGFPQKIQNRIP